LGQDTKGLKGWKSGSVKLSSLTNREEGNGSASVERQDTEVGANTLDTEALLHFISFNSSGAGRTISRGRKRT
jgi:hypothetical protein